MTQSPPNTWSRILAAKMADEGSLIDALSTECGIPPEVLDKSGAEARRLIADIRSNSRPGLLESLLVEYGLGSGEGIALLRVAEALLRVPDTATIDALIEDKLVAADWRSHRGRSPSSMVNLATLGLQLSASILKQPGREGATSYLRRIARSACRPAVRLAVSAVTRRIADHFVQGRTIEEAIRASRGAGKQGFCFSYDMLGEAALTAGDASQFLDDYKGAITALAPFCTNPDFRDNDGVSIKLSALHPRYEQTQRGRVLDELADRLKTLAIMARDANMGLNIDAEEADRLELSLAVIEKVLRSPELAGWGGFGIVVQAYGKAAPHVIDHLYALAGELDRKIMIRLVKGAYWDTEIKRAQVEGVEDFPVYTSKPATDIAYLCCARKLFGMTDRIYPQIAGHNAHTVSTILELAGDGTEFEFQRIHGMGEELHRQILGRGRARCRVYAPVGEHRELLPYLARRMLENGANSSFVNQIADPDCPVDSIAENPFERYASIRESNREPVVRPRFLFGDERRNSRGWDLHYPPHRDELLQVREGFLISEWQTSLPIPGRAGDPVVVTNPADQSEVVGSSEVATAADVAAAMDRAVCWDDVTPGHRAEILMRASELYEDSSGEFFALLGRESGKIMKDAIAELREAVDFLRYYATEAPKAGAARPAGLFACISPWNFPLAIFTGQIAGALAAGNGVLAKPAEQTPLIGGLATRLLHQAGVPENVLQLLPGGPETGRVLLADNRIAGVAFTGSTETARKIEQHMAKTLRPASRLIAETGGLNAMIADSTALPEQVIRDIVMSSFRSAGQRCSALRLLYLQADIHSNFLKMLFGAMDELVIGDPMDMATDIGPVIDADSHAHISRYIDKARQESRLLKQCPVPPTGHFVGPAVIEVGGIEDLEAEIFGPVLHVAKFVPGQLDDIIAAINASGYGLTFGMHSRIDFRTRKVADRLGIGNVYINRNQIGAVVGSQPFGGEGLSGTGPKAGGPDYLPAFTAGTLPGHPADSRHPVSPAAVQDLLDQAAGGSPAVLETREFPGPTGESNILRKFPRGAMLCLGPTASDAADQAKTARQAGCPAIQVAEGASGPLAISGFLPRAALAELAGIGMVALWSDEEDLRAARLALSERDGPIIPLAATTEFLERCILERHTCTDTTAAGGNATLFASLGRMDGGE